MLTPDERRLVIDEFADHIGLTGDVRQFISVVFGTNQQSLLLALPTNYTTVPDQAQFVVDHCLESRWSVDPSLLELLLAQLVTYGGKGNLAALRNRVHARLDPNPNVYKTLWVLADQPFIDRSNLRPKLTQLIEKNDRPILRVWGARGSGKSYTSELLNYVMDRARPDVHVASATLSIGNGPSYEVSELVETLALAFSPDEPIPERRNSSYAGALCRWVVRNTLKKPGIWIYLLDGFGQTDVTDEIREFVQMLAQQVCAPEFSRRLRLMLLDFDKPLTGNWRAKTLDDALPDPLSIQNQDLEDCLAAHNQRMHEQGTPNKAIKIEDLAVLANALRERAVSEPAEPLRSLYEALLNLSQVEGS